MTTDRRQPLRVDEKGSPFDLVTEVDEQAERVVVDGIVAARPDDEILGEEGAARRGSSGVRWIVDPLDGTANYVYGYPAHAVSIGVEVDGKPVVGVVFDTGRDAALRVGQAEVFARVLGDPRRSPERRGVDRPLRPRHRHR